MNKNIPLGFVFTISACLLTLLLTNQVALGEQKRAFLFTDFFTAEEKAQTGLSKLTEAELQALDRAIIRVHLLMTRAVPVSDPPVALPPRGVDLDLYGPGGSPVAYMTAGREGEIYLWSGKPCAYVEEGSIYGFSGKHLGWFESGLVYDHQGAIVAGLRETFRYPVQRGRSKVSKDLAPLKRIKEKEPLKPTWSVDWSSTYADTFFQKGAE